MFYVNKLTMILIMWLSEVMPKQKEQNDKDVHAATDGKVTF